MALFSDDRDRYDRVMADGLSSDTPDEAEERRKRDILTEALDRFKLVSESDQKQRDREREDLQFDRALPEDQWPADIRKSREASVGPSGAIPARPCLVVNKLDQPVQQVINEARQARLGTIIKAKGEKSSTKGAELRQGLIRTIEVDSGATLARMWALERAVKCGRGFYRLTTDYANDGDFDLDIVYERIKNQGCVYLDPYASRQDAADMEWAFLTEDVPKAEYRRRFKDTKLAKLSQLHDSPADELTSVTDQAPGWVEEDSIRIAEYWYIDHTPRTLFLDPLINEKRLLRVAGETYEDPAQPGVKLTADVDEVLPPGTKSRMVDHRTVKRCVINGTEIISEETWPGKYIPIIPVLGKEYVVDGDVTVKGIVSNAKHSQQIFNYMSSAEVEMIGLSTRAPWLADPKQIEGYEHFWHEANVRNFSTLPYNRFVDGVDYGPPIRNVAEPAIEAIGIAIMRAEGNIKATTGRFDPSLGQMSGERSGRAIKELKQQGENSTSNYLENLAGISMLHEARILLDLLPHIYDRKGRVMRLLGEDDRDEKHIMLGQPFTKGEDGRPVAVPSQPQGGPGMFAKMRAMLPGMPGQAPQAPQPEPELYDLQDGGEYACQVSVGRSLDTQRDANVQLITTAIEATKGQAAPFLMDLYAEMLDGPMGKRMAERFRKLNPQLSDDGQGIIPPQIQAQMSQMQQQMQQMGQALQQAQQALATDQAKQQAQMQMKQAEIASEERLGFARIRADLAKARATIDSKEAIAILQVEEERFGRLMDGSHAVDLEQVKGSEKRKHSALDALLTPLTQPPAPVNGEAMPAMQAFEIPPAAVAVGPSGMVNDPRF